MKNLKYIFSLFIIITAFLGCEQEDDLPDVSALPAPSNVAAVVTIAQDNSGLVTITPTGENVASFRVNYGDGSGTDSGLLNPGESAQNTYEEGVYEIVIAATGINGKTTIIAQTIEVSFQAPENLVVTIENDANISKQVNVTASADFAMSYEVNFGDPAGTIIMSNIDETTSFVYNDAGTYTITVTAFSGSVDTISYSEEFEVTEILAPLVAAQAPPARAAEDVVSVFSDAYTNVTLNELPTDWSSSAFEAITIEGDNVWKLSGLDFIGMVTNYDSGIDLSSMEKMHIDYWVPSGITNGLSVKIVNTVDGGEAEQPLGDTVAGSWQSIELDMTGFDNGNLANKNSITQLLIDSDEVAAFVYIDNFYFYKEPSVSSVPSIPVDFESTTINYQWTGFGDASFGPIPAEVIANPDATGINTSANVLKIEKTVGAQVWAGASMSLDGAIDFTDGTTINMKVWSPSAGATIRFKLEDSMSTPDANGNPTIVAEIDAVTTVANGWEVLSFDLTTWASFNTLESYDTIVIFPNFGAGGNGETFYFDDIVFANAVTANQIPVSFENSNIVYEWTGFGDVNFGPIPAAVIANPDATGINTSANVLEIQKTTGAQIWAGASMNLDGAVDFTNGTTINMKVWSPAAGETIRFKLEDSMSTPDANGNPTVFVEIDGLTTVSNSWEVISFDLTTGATFSTSESYDRIVIFPNFGANGSGNSYYFDDVELTN